MKNNRMRKLNGRLIALVMAVMTVFTVLPANVQAASNPYYSSQSVSDITPTDAKLNGSISNPSRTKITRCGYILYDAKGNQLSQKYDSINYTYTTFKAWFNMNKYYGKLKPGTTYKYKLFVMTSAGKYFYSKTASFTTAKLQSHSERMNAFIKDSRWKNGTAWDARKPKLSTYRSSGCCAYCADFVKYVYGSNNLVSGSKFTSVSKIKAGDVIYAASYYSNGKGSPVSAAPSTASAAILSRASVMVRSSDMASTTITRTDLLYVVRNTRGALLGTRLLLMIRGLLITGLPCDLRLRLIPHAYCLLTLPPQTFRCKVEPTGAMIKNDGVGSDHAFLAI